MSRRLTGAVMALLLAAACSSGGGSIGGADRLPDEPAPEDVAYAEAPEGTPAAPEFELDLLDGSTVSASELWDERPVVLHFVTSWCEICKEQQAGINEVADEYADEVVFLGITTNDTAEDIEGYLRERDVPYAVGNDPEQEIWLRYGVTEPPLLAFITRGGAIVRGHPGGLDGEQVRETIEEHLLAETDG